MVEVELMQPAWTASDSLSVQAVLAAPAADKVDGKGPADDSRQ